MRSNSKGGGQTIFHWTGDIAGTTPDTELTNFNFSDFLGTPTAENSLPTHTTPQREKDCDTSELNCHDKLHNRGISPTHAKRGNLGQIEGGFGRGWE